MVWPVTRSKNRAERQKTQQEKQDKDNVAKRTKAGSERLDRAACSRFMKPAKANFSKWLPWTSVRKAFRDNAICLNLRLEENVPTEFDDLLGCVS